MARIQRANVILDVDDSEVGYYTNLGYNLIDNKGNVIKKAMSMDMHTLQQELTDSQSKIEKLEAENKELKAEILALKNQLENAKSTPVEKPATRRKKAVEE